MGKHSWDELDYTESMNYNVVCRIETALWNLGIPTAVNDRPGDCDWPNGEVRRYSNEYGLPIGSRRPNRDSMVQ